MTSIVIKNGEKESASFTLAHWSLGAVYSPACKPQTVFIWGSHDNVSFGNIFTDEKPLSFEMSKSYGVHIFDPVDFEGVQFIKFVLIEPATEDLTFPIHIKDA